MKDWWIKLGCYLTGYNYNIVKSSSEASAKAVKKFASALLIISMVWCFIGYEFTSRYLHGSTLVSIIGAIIMVVMVIQIERQIILTIGKSRSVKRFRIIIGVVMAIIGSVIIDQVMFKDDIERERITIDQEKVNKAMAIKTKEINEQITVLDSSIAKKERERLKTIADISKNPTITAYNTQTQSQKDTSGRMVMVGRVTTSQAMPNPKIEILAQLDAQIKTLRDLKIGKENSLLTIRATVEKEVKNSKPFLEELSILFKILISSPIAFIVWALIFTFFFSIELFVLYCKFGDDKNDYDKTIMHQMQVRMQMIDKLNE
jgi:hypothetical protein